MIGLFFEQLALLGALSSLIVALFWPHLKPILSPSIFSLIQLLNDLVYPKSDQEIARTRSVESGQPRKRATREHPKFNGQALKRIKSEKDSILSAHYRSSQGFGRSPLDKHQADSFIHSAGLSMAGGSGLNQQQQQRAALLAAGQASSTPLTIFTASIIGLIVYTLMKTFTARFGLDAASRRETTESSERGAASPLQPGARRSMDHDGRDGWFDKRKLARMSREERARQLILRHGGRNVSTAIRFLASELEKQKRLLSESLYHEETISQTGAGQGDNLATGRQGDLDEQIEECTCACHHHHHHHHDHRANDHHETVTQPTTYERVELATGREAEGKKRKMVTSSHGEH